MILRTLLLALLAWPLTLAAANIHCGAATTGTGSGADWSNQADMDTVSPVRGNIYYVADGTYAARSWSTAASGSTTIEIRKATEADHGTATGWSSTYGDGVATWSGGGTLWNVTTPYWIFNGVNGTDTSGHGFVVQMTSTTADSAYGIHLNGDTPDYITLQHIEIYHTAACTANGGFHKQDGLRSVGADIVTVSYCYIHDEPTNLIITSGADNWTIERSVFMRSHSNATYHGQAIYHWNCTGWVIRWNRFLDINGSAVIFFKDTVTNSHIYGNVFGERQSSADCGLYSTGEVLGNNSTAISGVRFFNNTMYDMDGRGTVSDDIDLGSGSDNLAYNNIWIRGTGSFTNCTGSFNDHAVDNDSLFVDLTNHNLRLTAATTAGTDTGASVPGNDVDADGVVRGADGTWDRGAFEYVEGGADVTSPVVTIATPTVASTYDTSTATVTIGGTASDNVALTSVTWVNSAGGSGTASGTTSWSQADIALISGANVITVTATDSSANTSTDIITITYTPTVIRVSSPRGLLVTP